MDGHLLFQDWTVCGGRATWWREESLLVLGEYKDKELWTVHALVRVPEIVRMPGKLIHAQLHTLLLTRHRQQLHPFCSELL